MFERVSLIEFIGVWQEADFGKLIGIQHRVRCPVVFTLWR